MQDALNRILGLRLPVDGIIGPETRSAVRRLQDRQRLTVTGLVGPDTERALMAALGKT
jgi:peptidoglycan hydrolase-like protein with peptidoglycan-binding domain